MKVCVLLCSVVLIRCVCTAGFTWTTLCGRLIWGNDQLSDGHGCGQRVGQTVDLPDLHRVWLLYKTHPKYTCAAANTAVLTAFFPLFFFFNVQTKRVKTLCVRSRGWFLSGPRLQSVRQCLVFPSTSCLPGLPSPTCIMAQVVQTFTGCFTSMVSWGRRHPTEL